MDTTERPDERIVVMSPPAIETFEMDEQVSISPLKASMRRFLRDRRAAISLGIIVFLVLGSVVFPFFYKNMGPTLPPGQPGAPPMTPALYHDATYVPSDVPTDGPGTLFPLGPNSLVHPLGTDSLGRDLLARLMAGTQVSFELAILVELLDIFLGIVLGTLAGWYGGWLGTVLDRFTDIAYAFPGLLLIILMGASLGPIFDDHLPISISRVVMLTLAIGVLAWPFMMRQVRGQTLQLKEQQYVEAAKTAGTSDLRIILRHVVPNLMNIVIVVASLDILGTIVGEAGISLLGFGIQPPNASLGLMISAGLPQLYATWTELLWPVLILVILVVTFSFVGDGARDAFDPRTKD